MNPRRRRTGRRRRRVRRAKRRIFDALKAGLRPFIHAPNELAVRAQMLGVAVHVLNPFYLAALSQVRGE